MIRTVGVELKDVAPIPLSLRADPSIDVPVPDIPVALGPLMMQHYADSFPAAPPDPDPSSFGYLKLIAGSQDFRFHAFVATGSVTVRRELATGFGQAFCRLFLEDHFGVTYFAHMHDVINKPAHPSLRGVKVKRQPGGGDVPDYLCCGPHTPIYVAEAKGRFANIAFTSTEFQKWREQFERILVLGKSGTPRRLKGFIVASQLATEVCKRDTRVFTEDPDTLGDDFLGDEAASLAQMVTALHYGSVFRKLFLNPLASALFDGFSLAQDLQLQVPVWTCRTPPFEGVEFIGGYYETVPGMLPRLTQSGWQMPLALGAGHGVFVGLLRSVAVQVAAAARGNWNALVDLPTQRPIGLASSEIAWLADGTITAPLTSFLPTGVQQL